jgi:hypothetical protein
MGMSKSMEVHRLSGRVRLVQGNDQSNLPVANFSK